MKIKTEIFKSIFIITCEGDELNPVPVEIFLTSMKSLIQKNKLDILIDFAAVRNVEGVKLGAVARSLAKTEDSQFLIVCGISEQEFNWLKMTKLERMLTHTTNRNEALSLLYWERKRAAENTGFSDTTESFEGLKEAVKKSAAESFGLEEYEEDLSEVEHGEDQTDIIDIDDLEIVSIPINENERESKEKEAILHSHKKKERRKHTRVKSIQVTYDDVIVFCKNIVTGKYYTALILDFSLGGLLMRLSPPTASIGDELLVEGRIGRQFKFKEIVTCHSRRKDDFAFEFKDLSLDTEYSMRQMIDTLK